jgi:hypothetical protein
VGPKWRWELGIWEFIARNDIVGGHLGKQKHCPGVEFYPEIDMPRTAATAPSL